MPPPICNLWLQSSRPSNNMQPMVAHRDGTSMDRTLGRPGWTLLLASVAAFMTSLDNMVVSTALPTLRHQLGGSVSQLEWTMNAYYLTFACLLLAATGLGDRFGRRRVLALGLLAFAF